jgi:hypothetical protein
MSSAQLKLLAASLLSTPNNAYPFGKMASPKYQL